MSILWNLIIEKFDKISVKLQKPDLDHVIAVNFMTSLQEFVTRLQSQFDDFEVQAKKLAIVVGKSYCEHYKHTAKQSFPSGKSDTILQGRKKF